jgi:hypothetical protein
VALAFVRRRRLAHTGPLRDDAERYLLAMARGRVPPPPPPNMVSATVHIDSDPYRDWGRLVRRHARLTPPMKTAIGGAFAAVAPRLTREFADRVDDWHSVDRCGGGEDEVVHALPHRGLDQGPAFHGIVEVIAERICQRLRDHYRSSEVDDCRDLLGRH